MTSETNRQNERVVPVDVPIRDFVPVRKRSAGKVAFERLEDNIRAIGIIEPFLMYQHLGQKSIIDGDLRYQVLLNLKVVVVPCIVIDVPLNCTPRTAGGSVQVEPGRAATDQTFATCRDPILYPSLTKSPHDLVGNSAIGAGMAKALEPWVTSEEICKYLRISANTLTRWIADRGMPVHRVGRSLRFKTAEIDKWIRSGQAADGKGEGQA